MAVMFRVNHAVGNSGPDCIWNETLLNDLCGASGEDDLRAGIF